MRPDRQALNPGTRTLEIKTPLCCTVVLRVRIGHVGPKVPGRTDHPKVRHQLLEFPPVGGTPAHALWSRNIQVPRPGLIKSGTVYGLKDCVAVRKGFKVIGEDAKLDGLTWHNLVNLGSDTLVVYPSTS